MSFLIRVNVFFKNKTRQYYFMLEFAVRAWLLPFKWHFKTKLNNYNVFS